jgi:hypothetical protein
MDAFVALVRHAKYGTCRTVHILISPETGRVQCKES